MIKFKNPILNIRTGLFLFLLFIPGLIYSQSQKGRVLSGTTKSGIGYVNVGIIGRNIGTVSDESGNFIIDLGKIYDSDSLRFSMIGYETKTFSVGSFKADSIQNVYLKPRLYDIVEVKVVYHKPKVVKLGSKVTSVNLKSGFSDNELGSEMGIMVSVKGPVRLMDLNLNVATCTFDSVTYRLNIYQSIYGSEFRNILTEPIYVSFSKGKINKAITFDLSKYSIIVRGDLLISLELYKDLGEGSLLFCTEFFTGTTYHRKTSEGEWIEAPGVIGMYLRGQLLR